MNQQNKIEILTMALALFLLFGSFGAGTLWAADPPSAGKALINSAIDKYNDGNYREALDGLLASLKTSLTPEEKILALQYLGFVHIAYNREREALIAFEDAVRLNPALTLDPAAVSPKILDVFRRAKSRVVKMGTLVVTTSPPEAEVFLDGKSVGKTPLNYKEAMVGKHKVKVVRENHAAVEQEVEIRENAETALNFNLVLNAGTLSVVTEPPGVTVYVDEVPQGKTPVIIKNVLEGERKITLRGEGLDGYSDKLVFKAGAILAMEVKLAESSGVALINSIPGEAEVFVDGKAKGKTPLIIERMPSGKHNLLLLKAGVGRWEGEMEVKRGLRAEITGTLRPSLAVIPPLVREGQPPEGPQDTQRLTRFLAGLKDLEGLNVYFYDRQNNPNLFKDLGIIPLELAVKTAREALNPERVTALLQALAREMKVDVILMGVYNDPAAGGVTWSLFNLYHAVPDVFDFKVSAEDKDISLFRRRFQASWRLRYPWLGLVAVETWLASYPLVAQVTANGPAARAGIKPGDGLLGINRQKIKNYQELQVIVDKQPIDDEIILEIMHLKNPESKKIKLEAAYNEIPLDNPRILYNLAMVELNRLAQAEETGPVTAAARLNLALVHMHFQEWERAAEILESLSFTNQEGLCQGTALFRLGQCYEALEQWRKAAEAYKKAVNYPRCTLINPDGPSAAQEAAIRLQFLAAKGRGQ